MARAELHLMCEAAGRSFAIPASRVIDVARYAEGTGIALADLSGILGERPVVVGPYTCVVKVMAERAGAAPRAVGLIVDSVTDVVAFDQADLVEPPRFAPSIELAYLAALARCGAGFAIVLDVDRLVAHLGETEAA